MADELDEGNEIGKAGGIVDLTAYGCGVGSFGLNDQVYRRVRQAILSGAYQPGERINIKPIAAQLGTSSMPVREALARLSAEGALEVLPRTGFVIPQLTGEQFRELLVLRVRLETLAGEYAAGRATLSDIEKISEAYKAMVASEKSGIPTLLDRHRKFHFAIYKVSGARYLIEMIENVWLKFAPQVYASLSGEMRLFHEYHYDILQALKAGDPMSVAKAIRNDIIDTVGPNETS